jgi:hypothetical protein
MALRLRRGTDTQRLLITPAEGELVYTTDTQRLYVGDGVTSGGILVNTTSTSSVGELNDVDITSETPATGDVLKWNGTQFAPAPDVGEGLIDYVIVPGSDYQINIVSQDSTRMVDGDNNRLNGDLYGKVYGDSWDDISNEKVIEINGRQGKLDIISDTDVLIVNHNNANYYDSTGSLLIDGGLRAFVGDVDGDLRGSMYDANLNKLIDNVAGLATLDLKGSVFGDDSTLLVDSVNSVIGAETYQSPSNTVTFGNLEDSTQSRILLKSVDETSAINLARTSTSDISGDATINYGSIRFSRDDVNNEQLTGAIIGRENALLFSSSSTGAFADPTNYFAFKEKKFGIGTITPTQELDVQGNAVMTGFVQFGSLTTTERDALAAANGMVIYNTTDNKFQGYENGAWANLI